MRCWPAGALPPQRQVLILIELLRFANDGTDFGKDKEGFDATEEWHSLPTLPTEKSCMTPSKDDTTHLANIDKEDTEKISMTTQNEHDTAYINLHDEIRMILATKDDTNDNSPLYFDIAQVESLTQPAEKDDTHFTEIDSAFDPDAEYDEIESELDEFENIAWQRHTVEITGVAHNDDNMKLKCDMLVTGLQEMRGNLPAQELLELDRCIEKLNLLVESRVVEKHKARPKPMGVDQAGRLIQSTIDPLVNACDLCAGQPDKGLFISTLMCAVAQRLQAPDNHSAEDKEVITHLVNHFCIEIINNQSASFCSQKSDTSDSDERALPCSLNSVLKGAKTPGCSRSERPASTACAVDFH